MITCQWKYVLYFILKKREKNCEEGREFSFKTKMLMSWLMVVLFLNSLNFFSYNIVELILELKNEYKDSKESGLLRIWNTISLFWYDLLNFTNGICFLFVFRSIALSTRKRKTKYLKKASPGLEGNVLLMSPGKQRQNHGMDSNR